MAAVRTRICRIDREEVAGIRRDPTIDAVVKAWPAAVRVCEGLLANREDAEDCASEAVLVALTAPGRLAEVRQAEAWVVAVAKRRAIDLLRRRSRQRAQWGRMAAGGSSVADDVADAIVERAEAAWLADHVADLPETTQGVIRRLVAGASMQQVVDELGLTQRAAESHLHRARCKLRAAWLSTFGALPPWIGRLSRRCTVDWSPAFTLTSAAVTMALATVIGSVQPATTTARAAVRHAAATTWVTQPLAVAAPRRAPRARPAASRPAPERRSLAPYAPSYRRTIARAQTPAGTVSVETHDKGGGNDLMSTLMGCLQQFQVSQQQIGC